MKKQRVQLNRSTTFAFSEQWVRVNGIERMNNQKQRQTLTRIHICILCTRTLNFTSTSTHLQLRYTQPLRATAKWYRSKMVFVTIFKYILEQIRSLIKQNRF